MSYRHEAQNRTADRCLVDKHSKPPRYAIERWTRCVLAIAMQPEDCKTVGDWAHEIGTSETSLRNICKFAGVKPKVALDFSRVLRAIAVSTEYGWNVHDVIDIADDRTRKQLFRRCGLDPNSCCIPTLESFLRAQTVVTAPEGLALVFESMSQHLANRVRSSTSPAG